MIELASSISIDLWLFFVVGLLGGAHCIGMCGPLLTVYSGHMNNASSRNQDYLSVYEVRQHFLFNTGRTVSYAILGGVFGFVGGFVFVTTESLMGISSLVRGSVGILIGIFVLAIGLHYLVGKLSFNLHMFTPDTSFLFGKLTDKIESLTTGPGIIALGGIHGFLPCPILYPAFLYAFAVGSAEFGVLSLGLLGLGTFPTMFIYGTLIEAVDPLHRQRLHQVLGAMFIILGYILLAHGLMSIGIHVPHPRLPHYQPLAAALPLIS